MIVKPGDVVQLVSGGPTMTASRQVGRDNLWECQWFEGRELKKGEFASEALEFYRESKDHTIVRSIPVTR